MLTFLTLTFLMLKILNNTLYFHFPSIKPFLPNTPFLYPLKTSKSSKVFWCFQGVEKQRIGNNWVKPFEVFTENVYCYILTVSSTLFIFIIFLFLRKKRLTKKNYFLEKFEENQKIVAFNLWSLPVKLGEFWHMSMSFHHCFIDVSILQPFATRRDKEVVVTSTIFRKYSSLFYQLTLKQKFLSLFLFFSLFFVKKTFKQASACLLQHI